MEDVRGLEYCEEERQYRASDSRSYFSVESLLLLVLLTASLLILPLVLPALPPPPCALLLLPVGLLGLLLVLALMPADIQPAVNVL